MINIIQIVHTNQSRGNVIYYDGDFYVLKEHHNGGYIFKCVRKERSRCARMSSGFIKYVYLQDFDPRFYTLFIPDCKNFLYESYQKGDRVYNLFCNELAGNSPTNPIVL